MTDISALAVQEAMLADLTDEQRARYDALLREWRTGGPAPEGLVKCGECGWVTSPSVRCNCPPAGAGQ